MYLIVNSEKDINKLNKVKNSSNLLVWYYADWCGHCKMMKDEWSKFVKSKPNVSLAKVSDKYVKQTDNIAGFPTLKLYKSEKTATGKNNVKIIDYQGTRDSQSLNKFIKENIKSIRRKSRRKKASSKNKKKKGLTKTK